MPGRKTITDDYRFAYNGMELDNEVRGNGGSYTTEFRQYDPRLGRWLSLDPDMEDFPEMSPYVAYADNPILYVDITGERPGPGWLSWVSTALDFVPIVGQIKAGVEAAVGYNMDGTKMSAADRALALISLIPGGALVNKAIKGVKTVLKVVTKSKIFKKAGKIFDKLTGRIYIKKAGASGGKTAGKKFSQKVKKEVIDENKAKYKGETVCENCGTKTVPAQKSQKGVTPPKNETQVDHIIPKSKGGDATLENGQVLCRDCNIQKSDNLIQTPSTPKVSGSSTSTPIWGDPYNVVKITNSDGSHTYEYDQKNPDGKVTHQTITFDKKEESEKK